jgi:hypothetical protein
MSPNVLAETRLDSRCLLSDRVCCLILIASQRTANRVFSGKACVSNSTFFAVNSGWRKNTRALSTATLNLKRSHMLSLFAFSIASKTFLLPLYFCARARSSESRPSHLAFSTAFLIWSARSLS